MGTMRTTFVYLYYIGKNMLSKQIKALSHIHYSVFYFLVLCIKIHYE